MPKIHDVARLAGVSTATVSKVLSNTPYVASATRERVLAAVAQLGYRPNLAARALSTGKTDIIGVVFPYVNDPIFKDPLVLAVLEGIEGALADRGYSILLSTPRIATPGTSPDAYLGLLKSGYIEGVIAIDSVPGSPFAADAQTQGLPLVVLGYQDAPLTVRSDDRAGGALALRHLLDLGHRRIGVIGVPPTLNEAVNARLMGIADAVADRPDVLLVRADGDFSTPSGEAAAAALLARDPRISAILCLNDRMAIGALHACAHRGLSVPGAVSVVGYDDLPIAGLINPALTTISQHAIGLGARAAELLLALLDGAMPSSVVLPPTLHVRGSTARCVEMDNDRFSVKGAGDDTTTHV